MASVTGNYVTSAGAALPANVAPRVEAIPSMAAVAVNGRTISQRPQTVTPNTTTGAYTLELIPTVDVPDAGFHYTIRGYYLDPDMYEPGKGGGRVDVFEHKIYVPTAGGSIGDLIRLPRPIFAWVIVSLTTPPLIPGALWLNADPNGNPDLGTGNLYEGRL